LKIGFFARVPDPGYLDRVEFYRQDIEILRSLGHEVVPAIRLHELPRDADLYWIWWWTWAFQPLLLAKVLGKPGVVTGVLDHPYPFPDRGFQARPAWQRAVMKWALREADANVFISEHEATLVPKELDVARPLCLHLAVDTDFYSPPPEPASREDFVLTVIWMESFNVWRKCALELVRAIPLVLERHPEARFVVAGERHDGFPLVESEAKRLGVESAVRFPGVVSREEKLRLMRTCRLYLQPTRYEGFGAAILEAMSCAAPVVSNPAGAVPEVVGDAGLLLPDPEPQTIAGAVSRLWDDAEGLSRLGIQGRLRALDRFSYAAKRMRLEKILGSLTGPS
jgi:glycosyltransferase involved in cell wall biosynthesis